ncbi:MAG: PKD domain-containing protein [Bacteroidales bacterium]|nr:PKD domain-containing protein [Bacteroidales bacterium]
MTREAATAHLTFTSASIDTAAAITTLYWDFGDGTLDTLYAPAVSVTHKYSTPGTYTATLTVEDANGCTSTVTDSVRRAPCIVAAYIASDTLLCQNYSLNFSDLSTCDGTISQWVWTWGDTSQPVSYNVYQALTPHTFTQPGTFLVKLKVTTLVGGTPVSDSATRVVTVVSTPTCRLHHRKSLRESASPVHRYLAVQRCHPAYLPLAL